MTITFRTTLEKKRCVFNGTARPSFWFRPQNYHLLNIKPVSAIHPSFAFQNAWAMHRPVWRCKLVNWKQLPPWADNFSVFQIYIYPMTIYLLNICQTPPYPPTPTVFSCLFLLWCQIVLIVFFRIATICQSYLRLWPQLVLGASVRGSLCTKLAIPFPT